MVISNRIRTKGARFLASERGGLLPLFAFLCLVLIGFVVLVLPVEWKYYAIGLLAIPITLAAVCARRSLASAG